MKFSFVSCQFFYILSDTQKWVIKVSMNNAWYIRHTDLSLWWSSTLSVSSFPFTRSFALGHGFTTTTPLRFVTTACSFWILQKREKYSWYLFFFFWICEVSGVDLNHNASTPLVRKDESSLVCAMLWVLFIGSGLEAAAWTVWNHLYWWGFVVNCSSPWQF